MTTSCPFDGIFNIWDKATGYSQIYPHGCSLIGSYTLAERIHTLDRVRAIWSLRAHAIPLFHSIQKEKEAKQTAALKANC